MNYSIGFASIISFALAAIACSGFTGVGQGGEGGAGTGATGGTPGQGGFTATGGAPGAGGALGSGGALGTGGAGTCEVDTDCPEVELCSPCANGSCAEPKCLQGTCQITCDITAGACSAERASCANGESCCAGLECCAGVPVPEGNEYCGKVCPKSDQNIKRDFVSVDPNEVLDKLSRLPVGLWSYQTEGSTVRHIGPMAQDFMASFGVGSSDRTIMQVDADGVSFAAIQALNARLTALEEQNRKLQQEVDAQRRRCER